MIRQRDRILELSRRCAAAEAELQGLQAKCAQLVAERESFALQAHSLQGDLAERERRVLDGLSEIDAKREDFEHRVRTCLDQLEVEMRRRVERSAIEVDRIAAEKSAGFPWLERAIARYLSVFDFETARELANKTPPAPRGAEEVKRIAEEKRALKFEAATLRNRVEYYESMFPWITEYVTTDDIDDVIRAQLADTDSADAVAIDRDPIREWLPAGEYEKLKDDERCQMALDRYTQSGFRTAWHAGREYERYIGYRYEQAGYDVAYEGAVKRKSDYGRDLLAKKNNEHLVIQCKWWREERTIREKHIQQLFGTTVEYMINELKIVPPWSFDSRARSERATCEMLFGNTSGPEVEPVLEVTTKLSDDALRFADALGVTVKITEFDRDYPRIKCNINPDGSKIFHLPMDQMYDRVKIEPHKGEFFAKTVAEAIERGFRRAYRWRGSGDSGGLTS